MPTSYAEARSGESVVMGENLEQRYRAYAAVSCGGAYSDTYAKELGEMSGKRVEITARFFAKTSQATSYNVKWNGKLYGVRSLFIFCDEGMEAAHQVWLGEVAEREARYDAMMQEGK